KLRRPLILLIATRRAPGEVWLAVTQRERWTQRRARTLARCETGRMLFIKPEPLRPPPKSETPLWNGGRIWRPTAPRGRGDHVAGRIDDVEMHRVAAHFAHPTHSRFASSKRADGNTSSGFATQFNNCAKPFDRAGLQFQRCSVRHELPAVGIVGIGQQYG